MTSNLPLRSWIRALDYSKKHRNDVLPALLPTLAHGDDIALIGEHSAMTYADLNGAVDHYARWGLAHGLRGKTVGLLLHNCPAYFAIWVGLSRLGCVVALLNTNQSGDILRHSLDTADVAAVITLSALTGNLGDDPRPRFLWSELAAAPTVSLDGVPMPRPDDLALLIYTSGTTGLPKATRITHRRIVEWSYWFAGMVNVQRDDRLYNCLPMYHSIGGIVAVGSMLVGGGSVVIRERFSGQPVLDRDQGPSLHHFSVYRGNLPLPLAEPSGGR
jgi:fatty-acyl-CoA synthase